MKIASKRTLDGATCDTIAQVLGRHKRVLTRWVRLHAADWERLFNKAEQRAAQSIPEGNMNQKGTTGTKFVKASRAQRKVRIRKAMRLVPAVVRAAPDDKLSLFVVRRGKASFFSGCKSHLATVAPASSNRSGSGGNDAAEAFDGKDRCSDSANRQALT